MTMARGQASTETTIMLAITLGAMLFLLIMLLGVGTTTTSTYEAGLTRSFTDTLADTAEQVWRQGEGARDRVYVQIPDSVTSIVTNGTSIVLSRRGGQAVYVRVMSFNITGNLSANRSGYWATVERAGGKVVVRPI